MTDLAWTNTTKRLGELTPWPRNPRQIKTDQAKRLAQSFEEFGQVETIAIGPNNEVYNGHQRLKVLMDKYGPEYEVECRQSSRVLTEKEREKLTVFLHRGAAGEWDWDTLANEFEFDELVEWGFDAKELSWLDFGGEEPKDDPGAQVDKAEELREKWGVEAGQLWQLGEHRIICGDCTDPAVVERVMQGEKAGAVVADPPYGMNLDTDYSEIKGSANAQIQGREGKKYAPVIGDDEDYDPRPVMKMFDKTDEQFWWGADYYAERIPDKNKGSWIVWDKRVSEDADKIIGSCFELCWSKTRHKREIARIKWIGAFGYADARERTHPTQKPIALIEWILERYTESDTIVVDPYSGSGTTLIACERLGRKCRAIEISPAYVAVTLQRWADMTGQEPVLVEGE